jgi:signal transduction histidine kinase
METGRGIGEKPVSEIAHRLRRALAEVSERERTIRDQAEHLQELNGQLEATLAALRETQAQLIEQERVRTLSEMATQMAHELNNALSPVLGFAELLLARPRTGDDQTAQAYLKLICEGAEEAAAVERRLGTLAQKARAAEGRREAEPLADPIAGVAAESATERTARPMVELMASSVAERMAEPLAGLAVQPLTARVP